ncbi:TPA: hypothetical protein ACOEC1_000170 [Stenotrophomonas maltophilia]|uniref:hypothetical protein n=1 Tax=Stenotrophomonas maltophilia TaxID=40324 RepID=UPI003452010D
MAQQIIDTTTDHGTYKGDPAKVAFEKVNANDTELYERLQTLAQLAGKNMLMNCGIPINQRNFAGGALAQGSFGYDRWKGGNGGGNIVINNAGVWTLNGPVQQVVENPQLAWGRPITFSAESPSGPIGVYMGGAVGSIPAGPGRQSVTLLASGSGNMLVDISAASSTTFSQLQMERGEKATAFEVRSIGHELMLCQRFTRYGYVAMRANGTTNAGAGTFIAHEMRATPAVTFSNTVYAYGCSGIGSSQTKYGVEVFVSPSGNFAFASNYLFDAEL